MTHVVGNMHMHTPYSDGEKYHRDIADAAIDAGLDFIIVTDHNLWIDGVEGYIENEHGRVLLLSGEEVHDVRRKPQANHLLIYGAETELSQYGRDPQKLINQANRVGAYTFLAHPHEAGLPDVGLFPDLGWKDWGIEHFTGLEIWNYMSSFINAIVRALGDDVADTTWNKLRALPLAFRPEKHIVAPEPRTLAKWDELLAQGKRVAAVGNSDAHGTPIHLGPMIREIFPYEYLFRAVNTHLVLDKALSGEFSADKSLILNAIGKGASWIGYDIPHPTEGFRFSARGLKKGTMGDEVELEVGATLQAVAPALCKMRMIRHGKVVESAEKVSSLTYTAEEPGAYRVECLINFKGRERGWIYSNPIYLK
jgi:hypothetical protein